MLIPTKKIMELCHLGDTPMLLFIYQLMGPKWRVLMASEEQFSITFSTQFKASDLNRPGIDNLNFNSLNLAQCGELMKSFSLEEVKNAVGDCDSFKSSRLD